MRGCSWKVTRASSKPLHGGEGSTEPRRGRPLRLPGPSELVQAPGPDCPDPGCRGPGLVRSFCRSSPLGDYVSAISGQSPPGSQSSFAPLRRHTATCLGAGVSGTGLAPTVFSLSPPPWVGCSSLPPSPQQQGGAAPPSPGCPVPPGISRTLGPSSSPPWPSCLPTASSPALNCRSALSLSTFLSALGAACGPRTQVPDLPASREVDGAPVQSLTCHSPCSLPPALPAQDGIGHPSSGSAGRARAVCGRACGTRVTLSGGGLQTCCHLSLRLGPGLVPAMNLGLPVCNREK